jgi:hypothetical protein
VLVSLLCEALLVQTLYFLASHLLVVVAEAEAEVVLLTVALVALVVVAIILVLAEQEHPVKAIMEALV